MLGRVSKANPSSMSASAINKELDKLDAQDSQLMTMLIDTGRGYEKRQTTLTKSDPLSLALRSVSNRYGQLRMEIERRYGPGAPHRLPKGFGPIK